VDTAYGRVGLEHPIVANASLASPSKVNRTTEKALISHSRSRRSGLSYSQQDQAEMRARQPWEDVPAGLLDGPRRHLLCQNEAVEGLIEREPSVSDLTRILALTRPKPFSRCTALTRRTPPALCINLRRAQIIPFFRKLPRAIVALEACGSSHYWARELAALGHTVRLMPPQYVKLYVKRGKNDRNYAEAICEAAGRPGIGFVASKDRGTASQGYGVESARYTGRSAHRTVRGHAAEFGIIAAKGAKKIDVLFSTIEQKADIPPAAREMFVLLRQQIDHIDARIAELDARLNARTRPIGSASAWQPFRAWVRRQRNTRPAASSAWAGSAEPATRDCVA